MKMRLLFLLVAATFTTSSCSLNANRAVPKSDEMILDRLYFGRNIPSGGEVSDSAWRAFVAEAVTPRFPEGLTTWGTHGQWRDPKGVIAKEEGYILELTHPAAFAPDTAVRAIMQEYIRRFKQDAVLRIQTRVRMELESAAGR